MLDMAILSQSWRGNDVWGEIEAILMLGSWQMSASSTKVGISHVGAKSPRYLAVQECHWIKLNTSPKARRKETAPAVGKPGKLPGKHAESSRNPENWKLDSPWFTWIGWDGTLTRGQLHLETSRYLKRHYWILMAFTIFYLPLACLKQLVISNHLGIP